MTRTHIYVVIVLHTCIAIIADLTDRTIAMARRFRVSVDVHFTGQWQLQSCCSGVPVGLVCSMFTVWKCMSGVICNLGSCMGMISCCFVVELEKI